MPEVETGHLPEEATVLNSHLEKVLGGLKAIDEVLVATAGAAASQEGGKA